MTNQSTQRILQSLHKSPWHSAMSWTIASAESNGVMQLFFKDLVNQHQPGPVELKRDLFYGLAAHLQPLVDRHSNLDPNLSEKVSAICEPTQRDGLSSNLGPKERFFLAGEWWQLPVIQMPSLPKAKFFMPGNGGNSPLSKCHLGLKKP